MQLDLIPPKKTKYGRVSFLSWYLEVVKLLLYEAGLHVRVGELLGLPAGVPLQPEETLQKATYL